MFFLIFIAWIAMSISIATAQCDGGRCPGGVCPQIIDPQITDSMPVVTLLPLEEDVSIDDSSQNVNTFDSSQSLELICEATCRVTNQGSCGSGTVVGSDAEGRKIILTNAHVAGTRRGQTVNVERWNSDGTSETSTATIIAAGHGKGMSIDFALLRAEDGFGKNVRSIPLADRYPDTEAMITTCGCPRCEWPSLQVLQMNRADGQVLRWKPEAIGGRSGSAIVDHTTAGPRVVGLLTWGGGGEGLGQSTPFLLSAMRGKLPAAIESLPQFAVPLQEFFRVPATTAGEPLRLALPVESSCQETDRDTIDAITEQGLPRPGESRPSIAARFANWMRRVCVTVICCVVAFVAGYVVRNGYSAYR
jgi:hypothetical protein